MNIINGYNVAINFDVLQFPSMYTFYIIKKYSNEMWFFNKLKRLQAKITEF